MKILIFHQYFNTPFNWGGTRQFYFTEELIRAGHEVVIITGSKSRSSNPEGSTKAIVDTVSVSENKTVISISDGYKQKHSKFRRVISFFLFSLISSLLALRYKDFDVVFASSTPLTIAIPAIIYSKFRKVPMVFEVRDIWPEAPVALGYLKNKMVIRVAEKLELKAYKQAESIITLSKGMKKKIEKKTDKKVFLITNGVDDDFFTDKECVRKDEKIYIVYAGSCGFNNAIDIVVGVANRIIRTPGMEDKVSIKIIGDGPALEKYHDTIDSRIEVPGRMPKKQVISELLCSDIALYPQKKIDNSDIKKDALPNKFFDYIGAGLAIVASIESSGEAAELIKKYNCGMVSEPESIEDMYNNALLLIHDSDLRKKISDNSKRLAQNYRRSRHAEEYRAILENTYTS